jgi:Cdc6-like AAA superfamily ATPase
MLAQMFADLRCSPSCTRAGIHGTVSICPPDCFQYKGTLDVFYKIIRQVSGFIIIEHIVKNVCC